ncbi:MAG: hypothetical protein AAGA77_21435 [Bacteroidota bacterium]
MKFFTRLNAILFLVLTLSFSSQAQNSNPFSFGFNISQVQNDFGIGIDIITPYFSKSKVAFRISGNIKWFEYVAGEETTWSPYQSLQFGIRGRQFIIEDKFFAYGEGGLMVLLPNSDFSSDSVESGGYGLFGFEFKPSIKYGFFLEMGGVGIGAKADRVANIPIYSNGFISTVGFRITP